ncbi:MAG: DUF192 domain-containing protein [Candidatus Parvarchaeum sp.]
MLIYYNGSFPLSFYFNKTYITLYNCSSCQGVSKEVYLAISNYQLQRGMMYRNTFEGAYGMLFVFNSSQQVCMWMANTRIPLEQSWILQNGTINFIKNAKPFDLNMTCAYGNYVLETPPNTVKMKYRFFIGNV